MKLTPLFELQGRIGSTTVIGQGPLGKRMIAELTGGSFSGERLSGQILSPGADWVIIDSAGYGHIDVRLTLATTDGAHIYMQYSGILEYTDKIRAAFADEGTTEFGDSYFVTQARFETGDARYSWLNTSVGVAEGRLLQGGVQYRVYICEPGE